VKSDESITYVPDGKETVEEKNVEEKEVTQLHLDKSTTTNNGIKELVTQEFGEDHIMVKIAKCESSFRQFKKDGTLLYNEKGSSAVGVFQIMESYHLEKAKELGLDIHTTIGNIAFALYLYQNEGTTPWAASSFCWKSL